MTEEHPIFEYHEKAESSTGQEPEPLPASVRITRAVCWLLFGVAFLAWLTVCMLVGNGVIHQ